MKKNKIASQKLVTQVLTFAKEAQNHTNLFILFDSTLLFYSDAV